MRKLNKYIVAQEESGSYYADVCVCNVALATSDSRGQTFSIEPYFFYNQGYSRSTSEISSDGVFENEVYALHETMMCYNENTYFFNDDGCIECSCNEYQWYPRPPAPGKYH